MHKYNKNLPKKILAWYDNNKRTLPWRISKKSKKKHYYRILSEFMLQQTQVNTVIPYFKNFVRRIPNLKLLSLCKEKTVLKLWEGLGYYQRCINFHKALKIVVNNYKQLFVEFFCQKDRQIFLFSFVQTQRLHFSMKFF